MDTESFTVDSQVDMTCMEGGESLFLLSSGFNLTLSEYHNTKLQRKTILSFKMLVS